MKHTEVFCKLSSYSLALTPDDTLIFKKNRAKVTVHVELNNKIQKIGTILREDWPMVSHDDISGSCVHVGYNWCVVRLFF